MKIPHSVYRHSGFDKKVSFFFFFFFFLLLFSFFIFAICFYHTVYVRVYISKHAQLSSRVKNASSSFVNISKGK